MALPLNQSIDRTRRWLAVASALGAGFCFLGVVINRQQFFISFLFAYLFWFGIAIGCLGILLIHHVTGGAWGEMIRPQLEAAAQTIPLLSVLFIPVVFGLRILFPWARPEVVAADPLLMHKHLYLNVPFFCARALFYFALWSVMAFQLTRPRPSARWSAPGLGLYALTLTFAILDWMMSLEPTWSSTIYSPMVIIGQMLTAFAFVTCGLRFLRDSGEQENPSEIKPFWDLGNMLLAFVMFWAYMAFSQYLIIWSANLPEEIPWYLHRQEGGWFWIAMALIFFQFILPFLVLLGRLNKQKLDRLSRVAVLILCIGALNTFWLVEPAFYPSRFHIHWVDAATLVAIGSLWLAHFLGRLKQRPALVGKYMAEVSE